MSQGRLGVDHFETIKAGPRKGLFTDATLGARDVHYKEVTAQVVILPPGEYLIEVAEILYKDIFPLDFSDQEVIFKDTEGRVISLKEYSTPGLVSRHSLACGVIIRLTVEQDKDGLKITNCIFIRTREQAQRLGKLEV